MKTRTLFKHSISKICIALALLSTTGCVSPFIYDPPGTPSQALHLPVKVAVFGFEDATDDFLQTAGRGPGQPWVFNLAKGGGKDVGLPQIPAQSWSQFLCDDLQAAGSFDSTRFLLSPAALAQEEILVNGSVLRANLAIHTLASEFSIRITATRRSDGKMIYNEILTERKVLELGACTSQKCGLKDINKFLQEIFQNLYQRIRQNLTYAVKTSAAP